MESRSRLLPEVMRAVARLYETDEHGNIYVKPTESHAASPTDEAETSTEAFHPSNPQETTAEVPVGPGYEHSTAAVPEATTSAGPASQSEAQSSVTVPGGCSRTGRSGSRR